MIGMKAIVMTFDRYRAVADHMIWQYEKLWPDNPFTFRIPYQTLRGTNSERREYIEAPSEIRPSILQLLADIDDEDWIYWCPDDKYPVRFLLKKMTRILPHVLASPEMGGLLFCRCRVTLGRPDLALHPGERVTPDGDVLLERKAWYQFWIHQFMRAKVLRYFFSQMPEQIPNAKAMDDFKSNIAKLPEHRLFVTKENLAVFGESTHRGLITRNCYDSIRKSDVELPEWFSHHSGERITMGKL